MNQFGFFTKSASAPASPTLNGYAHLTKLVAPISVPSQVVLPPHIRSPSYVEYHQAKPAVPNKVISLNDLEEGVKLTILSDIE